MAVAQLVLGDVDVSLLVLGVVILLRVDRARRTCVRGVYLAGGGHLLVDVAGWQLLVLLESLVLLVRLLRLLLLMLLLLVVWVHWALEPIAGHWSLLITRLLLLLLLVGTQDRRGGIRGRGGVAMPTILAGCLAKTGHLCIVGRYVGVLAHVPAMNR